MGVFEVEKKMVAGSADHRSFDPGPFNRPWWRFCAGALYLYIILVMDKKKHLETLLVIVLGCIAAYWVRRSDIFLAAALLTGVSGLLLPKVAQGIYWGWMKLSELLGWVSGKLLLTVIYILILMPLSFFARRLGKITLRLTRSAGSYFKDRSHKYTREDFLHPW